MLEDSALMLEVLHLSNHVKYFIGLITINIFSQQIAFKNLVERNRTEERVHGAPSPNSAIQLPFIIVNTNKKTVIDCSISNDK